MSRNPMFQPQNRPARSSLSRRGLLRGAGLGGAGLALPGLLTACGTPSSRQTAEECVSTDRSAEEKELMFSNWPEYIDRKKKRMPTLEDFEERTGIEVTYNADVNDNTDFFAKIQNQLGDCQPIGRDIFVLSDWMVPMLVGLGWLQELDHDNMPNVRANMLPRLSSPSYDPDREYSVPWQSGMTGIAYNAKYTGEDSSFEELLTRADLKNKVSLLTELDDTMGFMLRMGGADPDDFGDAEWDEAIDRLEGYVAQGRIRRFTGNDYLDDLLAGNIVACEAWSGDVIAAQYDNPDIKFVVPEEGVSIWSDEMLVPNRAEHKTNAELLMDHYYDPEVAARLAAWVNYICPVAGAEKAMEKVDPSLVGNRLIFPDEQMLSQAWEFQSIDDDTRRRYQGDFRRAMSA